MNPHPDACPTPQDEIRILREKLASAQKTTALGELLGTTVHEFNNVLTTVINYAKIGLRHRDDATRDKALERILSAGERAARITQSVLGLARNRSASFEPTDIADIVSQAMLILEREMRKYRIGVEYQFQADVPEAMANGNQIQQVLFNLLVNARQAMPNGGNVVIGIQYDPAPQMVCLSVRDTGAGMSQEVMHRIFDPYFSTKSGPDESGKGGAGLGLSACRDIIEAHQGKLRVQSTVGKGTCFTIMLPASQTPGQMASTAAS